MSYRTRELLGAQIDTMTNDKPTRDRPKRQYPPFYERFVPIALGIIVAIVVILLLIIFGVALGLFPWAG